MAYQEIPLLDGPVSIEGAVSLEQSPDGLHPWRLPIAQRDLFEPSLVRKASMPAGVRLTFTSDTGFVQLETAPPGVPDASRVFDLLVDRRLHQRIAMPPDETVITFSDIPPGEHLLELYLPSQYVPVVLRRLRIDTAASARRWRDTRKRIVFYGSSITHCRQADGPSETWPAIVANREDLHLTSLGFGGDCHMDPMVGEMIRDLPADYIGLKLGINMMSGSVNDRTFRALAIGLIRTIRTGHSHTPLAVVSPVYSKERESTPNAVGMTLELMRQRLSEAVAALRAAGDANLHYASGMELMGAADRHLYADGTHPSGEGYRFLADAYSRTVMPLLRG